MKILLIAFEPFGGEQINAALESVNRVKAPENVTLTTLCVPTVFGLCTETVVSAMHTIKPDIVVCVGQASGRSAITPERVAINIRDARIPDNAGHQPVDQQISSDGPAAYFSTLPIRSIVDTIQKEEIPAAISNSAGTFVCNDLFYGVMHAVDLHFPGVKAGFIHVPCTPEQAASANSALPSMDLTHIIQGLEAAIRVLAKV